MPQLDWERVGEYSCTFCKGDSVVVRYGGSYSYTRDEARAKINQHMMDEHNAN